MEVVDLALFEGLKAGGDLLFGELLAPYFLIIFGSEYSVKLRARDADGGDAGVSSVFAVLRNGHAGAQHVRKLAEVVLHGFFAAHALTADYQQYDRRRYQKINDGRTVFPVFFQILILSCAAPVNKAPVHNTPFYYITPLYYHKTHCCSNPKM